MIQKGFHNMTWEMIKISFISNKEQLLLVLVICFVIGFVIAMMTSGYNKEKKKKGFKEGRLYGVIETEQARIEVLGTSFNIKSSDKSAFELAVRRGLVKVTLKKNGEQTLVKAGQTVSLFSNRLQVAPTQDNEQFSDYTRRIQFKDERLGDILHVINLEYPKMPLKTTADLENRRLTVSFYNNSPATMAELICAALKLKCTQQNNIWMISEP